MKRDVQAFRQLAPAKRLAALRGEQLERTFQIERGGVDEKARTAWLSIASEEPYARWWGVEVLDMKKDSIRQDRLKSGAPLLVDHDGADQVGIVEGYEITADKKLRILARFGRSERADEIFRDVLDGIRKNASVGYIIHDLVLEQQEEDVATYRVTDWEPLEGSLVAVPADPTVGVGRSASTQQHRGPKMENEDNNVAGALAATVQAERERVRAILVAGIELKDVELANEVAQEPGATVQTLKSRILDKQRHTSRSLGHGGDTNLGGGMPFGAGAREVLAKSKYFKGPDAERHNYISGMWLRAQYGHEGAQRWIASYRPDLQVRAMSAASLAAGGAVVPIEMMQAIIDLKDAYGAFRANTTVWPMNSDQLKIPQSKTDTGAAFLGESDTIVETDGIWTNVTLSSKKIGSIVRVPTELFEDSIVSLADRVAFEIARQFAKAEDTAGFTGDGTSTYGGIQGFTSMIIDGSHNAGKIALPSGKNKFTDVTATDLASLIASLPAYAHDNAKFYVSPVGWGNTFFRLMQAVSGNRVDTMAGGVPRQYGGYPVVVTPVLPTSTGSLAASVMLLFGDLRRGAAFGDRQQIRVQVLMERYADNDQVGIKATERFDIITRHGCGDNTTAGPVVGLIGTA